MALDGLIDSGRRALSVAHRVVTPLGVLPAPLSRRFCGDMTVAGNAFSSPSALTARAEPVSYTHLTLPTIYSV